MPSSQKLFFSKLTFFTVNIGAILLLMSSLENKLAASLISGGLLIFSWSLLRMIKLNFEDEPPKR